MYKYTTNLHVLFALFQLVQFNILRNPLLHIVKRRQYLKHKRTYAQIIILIISDN